MSFCNETLASAQWVELARNLLRDRYNVYDYRVIPEMDPDLKEALSNRIAAQQIFVAVVDEDYLKAGAIAFHELQCAIKLATGSDDGLLCAAKGAPLVYVFPRDQFAKAWLKEHQPGFTYMEFENYEFIGDPRAGFLPVDPELWDEWIKSIKARLSVPPPGPTLPPGERHTILLGHPTASFAESVAQARMGLVELLKQEIEAVDDGWSERDGDGAANVIRKVIGGANGSVIIQPSDQKIQKANLLEGLPRGSDLFSKFRQLDISDDDAKTALARTVFWIPNTDAVPPLSDIREEGSTLGGPLFATGKPEDVANWIKTQLGGARLVLKAEAGIGDDIGPKFQNCVMSTFGGPLEFDIVGPTEIGPSIKRAATDSAPLLVLIHDRKINGLNKDPRREIRRKADDFDQEIEKALTNGSKVTIARGVLLIRYGEDEFPEVGFFSRTNRWTYLPLDSNGGTSRLVDLSADLFPPPSSSPTPRNAANGG